MKKLQFLLAAIFSLSLHSCSFGFAGIQPEGEYVPRTVNVGEFENVSVSSGMELILTQDSVTSVRVETYENIHKYINAAVVDNTLRFTIDFAANLINPKVKVYVNSPKIGRISGSGGTRLYLNSGWSANALEVHISGGSSVYGKVDVKELSLSMSGGGRSELEGNPEKLTIEASGGSSSRNYNLTAANANLSLSGGSSAHISVSDFLTVQASGGSSVRYKGNPEVKTNLSGGSSVKTAP